MKEFIEEKIQEYEDKKENHKGGDEAKAFWKGHLNIYKDALEKHDEPSFESWLEDRKQAAKDNINGLDKILHMICCGERDAVKEIQKEVVE